MLDKKIGNRNLYLLASLGFIISMGFGLIIPLFPLYVILLGGGALEVGILFSSFMFTRAIFATPFGNLSDRIGRKNIIVIGTFLYGILAFLFTVPTDWTGLLFVRAFQGVASAMVWPISEALVIDSVVEEKRGHALGTYIMASNAGFVIGPLIGGGLIIFGQKVLFMSVLNSYKFPFYFTSILAFIALILVVLWVVDIFKPMSKEAWKNNREEMKHIKMSKENHTMLNVLYLNAVINGFAMGIISVIFVLYMGDVFHLDAAIISIIFGVSAGVGMMANIPAGRYSDKVGRKPLILFGGYTSRLATLFMPFTTTILQISTLMVFRSLAFQISMPTMRALQADLIPEKIRGKLIGFMQTMFNVGAIIGPPIGGFLYDSYKNVNFSMSIVSFSGKALPFFLSSVLGFFTLTMILIYIKEPKIVSKAEVKPFRKLLG